MNISLRFFLSPTCIIREGALVPIKNKPTFFPSFNFSTHFDEESSAGLLCDWHMITGINIVASSLHVAAQIKVFLPDRQITGQRSSLEKHKPISSIANYLFCFRSQMFRSESELKSLSVKMSMWLWELKLNIVIWNLKSEWHFKKDAMVWGGKCG